MDEVEAVAWQRQLMRLYERSASEFAADYDIAADGDALPRYDRIDRVQFFAEAQIPGLIDIWKIRVNGPGGCEPLRPRRRLRIAVHPIEIDQRIL